LVIRPIFLLAAFLALGAWARAADLPSASPSPSLPSLAIDPQAPPPSIWKGLYVGTDAVVAGAKGSKPFVGGDAYIGYDHRFDNNLVLGIQASTGYAPYRFFNGPLKGYDYAEVSAKVGYEVGRFTPYLTTGIALAKPNSTPGFFSASDSINNIFNGSTDLAASGVIGAGFDYALTNNTTVGLVAKVAGSRGGFVAPP
jgi:opacity protein-like surface antigen